MKSEAQFLNDNTSVESLPADSESSYSTNSTDSSTDVIVTNGTTLFSSDYTIIMENPVSIDLNSSDISNISVISSIENLNMTTINDTITVDNTFNPAVNVPTLSNNRDLLVSSSYDQVEYVITTSGTLIQNSTFINSIDNTQSNEIYSSPLLDKTTSIDSADIFLNNVSVAVELLQNSSTVTTDIFVEHFSSTTLSLFDSISSQSTNTNDSSSNISTISLPIINDTYLPDLPSTPVLSSDIVGNTTSVESVTNSDLTALSQSSDELSTNSSLEINGEKISALPTNMNGASLSDEYTTVSPFEPETSSFAFMMTNTLNSNTSFFLDDMEASISTVSYLMESKSETDQESQTNFATIVPTSIFSQDNSTIVPNIRETISSIGSVILTTATNLIQETDNIYTTSQSLFDESSTALTSEQTNFSIEVSSNENLAEISKSTQESVLLETSTTFLTSYTVLSNESASVQMNNTERTMPVESLTTQSVSVEEQKTSSKLPTITIGSGYENSSSALSTISGISEGTIQDTLSTTSETISGDLSTISLSTVMNIGDMTTYAKTNEATAETLSQTEPTNTIESSATRNVEIFSQVSISAEPIGFTSAEIQSIQTITTHNDVHTTESTILMMETTSATISSTLSLLTILSSSASSQSTLVSNTNSYSSTENRIGSLSTASIFSSEETSHSNQYSSNLPTSTLSVLLSTLIRSSGIATSSESTIYSNTTNITESTSVQELVSGYPTYYSSISSFTNVSSEIININSTLTTTINTLNSTTFLEEESESASTSIPNTSSTEFETMQVTISSTESSSVLPSTSTNIESSHVTSMTVQQNTINTSIITPTMSTWLPSFNSHSEVLIESSSNTPEKISTIGLSITPLVSVNSFESSTANERLSYPTSLPPNLIETTSFNQIVSSATRVERATTLLSTLLATSSLLTPNVTPTMPSTFSSTTFTTQISPNSTNILPSNDCVFPFLYLGQWYERCISDAVNDSWCSLTDNFDRDRQWKYCRAPRVKTIGGTGNGSDCVFPFIYQGVSFSTCIYRSVTIGTTQSFSLFCSITSNLDQHGLWGYCLDYDSCYFPFIYNGVTYTDCISGPQSARWCSTTANFDYNKMWSNCPVTCDGYPQQDENSVGFRLLSGQRPCIFNQAISHDTGLVLKYYALPTCQLEPLCRINYVPLFKQIICREDGRYNYPRTICLPIR